MSQTFNCPSCGAPLDAPGGDETTMRCQFCNSSIIIPETIRGGTQDGGSNSAGVTDAKWSTLLPQIRRLLQENKKIEAVKLYRLNYGVGLVEAKQVVDAIERGELIQAPILDQKVNLAGLAEIGRLIRANQKIEAIKLYRQQFGVGLKEAKDAVEALERGETVQIVSTTSTFPVHSSPLLEPAAQIENNQRGCRTGGIFLTLILAVLVGLIGLGAVFFTTNSVKQVVDTIPPIVKEIQSTEAAPVPSNASLLLSFGEKGMGPGQFQDARSIAVDSQGNIFLAEYQGGRVLVFDSSGAFKNEWNTGDKKAVLLSLAVGRGGTISAVLSGDVLRYKSLTGELISRSKYGGTDKSVDYAVVTQDGGMLLIAGGENVWLFDAQGKQKLQILAAVSKVSDESELKTHAAVDGQGNIYLLGHFNNAVFKYSAQGKFLTRFGGDGDKPGQFRAPEDVAVDGQGRVYVTDINGIQIFDTNGRYLSTIKVDGAAFGMTIDDQGNLYVITNRPKVYKFQVNITP